MLEMLENLKSSGTCSLALSGKPIIPCGLKASDNHTIDSWIIDSWATDHMTHSSSKFCTYTHCLSSRKISVANGSHTTVTSLRDIQISPLFVLKNVLHVPKLSTNLVSIKKLTHDMSCKVIFYPTHYVVQDQDTGKKIGLAKEKDELYLFETPTDSVCQE